MNYFMVLGVLLGVFIMGTLIVGPEKDKRAEVIKLMSDGCNKPLQVQATLGGFFGDTVTVTCAESKDD